ncbi:glutathione-dependent formaldehyde-activating enzyme [Hymenopellis radicata]|nr:glutathione-dependent formaldehyde-activating enzyme [Hymenopellis radicata]
MSKVIAGGCLCGAIRYEIQFPEGTYPPDRITCQCTQCRKNSGALIAYFIGATTSNVTWTGNAPTEYIATPGYVRAFCNQCGSWLSWTDEKPGHVGILTGTLDEEFLRGEKGKELATTTDQVFCTGFIEGVTDIIKEGKRWEGHIGESKLLN